MSEKRGVVCVGRSSPSRTVWWSMALPPTHTTSHTFARARLNLSISHLVPLPVLPHELDVALGGAELEAQIRPVQVRAPGLAHLHMQPCGAVRWLVGHVGGWVDMIDFWATSSPSMTNDRVAYAPSSGPQAPQLFCRPWLPAARPPRPARAAAAAPGTLAPRRPPAPAAVAVAAPRQPWLARGVDWGVLPPVCVDARCGGGDDGQSVVGVDCLIASCVCVCVGWAQHNHACVAQSMARGL